MTTAAPLIRRRYRYATVAIGLCFIAGNCRAAEHEDPLALAKPGLLARLADGRRINFRCSGTGAPTVILESGWAANSLSWTAVRSRVSARHRTCAYDRAGSGFSDPGPDPRDGAAIAEDLDQALRSARIRGPFILVGHSAGGLYIRLFAERRWSDVAGFVFVDPSVEYQDRRLAERFGSGAGSVAGPRLRAQTCLNAAEAGRLPSADAALAVCTPPLNPATPPSVYAARLAEALRPTTWRAQLSELDTLWTLTSDEIARGRASYGDKPLIVLTAEPTPQGARLDPARWASRMVWVGLHQELASRSRRGTERVVDGSGHLMMRDRPDAIAEAIETVASEAGRDVSRPPGERRR